MPSALFPRAFLTTLILLMVSQLGYADDLPRPGVAPSQAPRVQPPAPPACGIYRVFRRDLEEAKGFLPVEGIDGLADDEAEQMMSSCLITKDGDEARGVCELKMRGEQNTTTYFEVGGRVFWDNDPKPVFAPETWHIWRTQVKLTTVAQCVRSPGVAPKWVTWKLDLASEYEANFFRPQDVPVPLLPKFFLNDGVLEQLQRTIVKFVPDLSKVVFDQKKYFRVDIANHTDFVTIEKIDSYTFRARGTIDSWYRIKSEDEADRMDVHVKSSPVIKGSSLAPYLVTAFELKNDKKRGFLAQKGVSKRWDELLRGTPSMTNWRRMAEYQERYEEVIKSKPVSYVNNEFELVVNERRTLRNQNPVIPSTCYEFKKVKMNAGPGSVRGFVYPHQRGIVSDPLLPYFPNDPALLKMPYCPKQ